MIRVASTDFDAAAEAHFQAVALSSGLPADFYAVEVVAGRLFPWLVEVEGRRIATLGVRREGEEAVFAAYGGEPGSFAHAVEGLAEMEAVARSCGCRTARCHVRRPALERTYGRQGYEVAGRDDDGFTVLRKVL